MSDWPDIFPEPWASDWGEDRHGLWMAFTYKGVRLAFRWIPPGAFMMGSPKDEPERFSDEGPQHRVTISEGFWLAETPVTQALWQVVMGENPSRFKGEKRPVESVSWEDAQRLIEALNQLKPELDLCLPTEAQWEYACRAGTTTPFHFGENITPEQVNYDGSEPYNNGAKGEYRHETVAVKALPANAWGLYQMHGNVWEWCQDWFGGYPAEPVSDPEGPATGTARVLRGGAWDVLGQYCRAAVRYFWGPGKRGSDIGFRLARGRTGPGGRGAGGA